MPDSVIDQLENRGNADILPLLKSSTFKNQGGDTYDSHENFFLFVESYTNFFKKQAIKMFTISAVHLRSNPFKNEAAGIFDQVKSTRKNLYLIIIETGCDQNEPKMDSFASQMQAHRLIGGATKRNDNVLSLTLILLTSLF